MRGMDLGSPNFFWDTLDMYRNHWNGFQAGTLQHPTWPIDTRGLMSIKTFSKIDRSLSKHKTPTKQILSSTPLYSSQSVTLARAGAPILVSDWSS